MKIKVYEQSGKTSLMELSPAFGEVKANSALVTQAVLRILANRRRPIASTKNRGEVAGGGRKPFRQKGTGRARAGSNRSPLWIGGGVTFGPRSERFFGQKINAKMNQKAMKMALSEKIKADRFIVISTLTLPKIGTAKVQAFLEKLPIEEGKILVILAQTNVNWELSVANLPFIKVRTAHYLNVLDLLQADYILTDKAGLEILRQILEGAK